jgi:2-desacetyl-2-hydroxyethyl bacteriochlorophyllide A dehydrogenase
MPKWLASVLGTIYSSIPKNYRPFLKKIFLWVTIRLQALFTNRRVAQGWRVQFLDFEIAYLEPYEYLTPTRNEVQVEARCGTVSPGTERAVLCGLPGARRAFPYTPGYSTAGRVLRVGKGVREFRIGDRVAGRVHHASSETVPASLLFRIPDGVSYESASFMELGIITLQGIRKAGIAPGDRVAVVGQGLIGQLANRFARLLGAAQVIAVAPSRNRAKTALVPGGADQFVVLRGDAGSAGAIQADVVIEAVGLPDAITTAMRCARDGGKVVLLGSSRGLGRDVDFWSLAQTRSLRLIGAHISAMPELDPAPGRWTYRQEGLLFLELLRTGRLKVDDLITWRARPEECNAVYEVIAKGGKDHVGILFEWKAEAAPS